MKQNLDENTAGTRSENPSRERPQSSTDKSKDERPSQTQVQKGHRSPKRQPRIIRSQLP
jgi:hypothetical protein